MRLPFTGRRWRLTARLATIDVSMREGRSSTVLLAAAGSGLVGGAVGALVVVLLTRGASTDVRAKPELIVEPSRPAAPQLEGRVATLERSLRALAVRESAARMHSPAAASAGGEPEKPPPADVAPIVDNPVFDAAVRDVMDRAEQERDAEREAQRVEWRKQAAQDWANALTEKLRLTELQKAKLVEISTKFWEQLRAARAGDKVEPESRQQRRERMDALRKTAEEELAKVLDASQLDTYRGLDEAERLGTPRNARQRQRPPATEPR
jgi:hypothetical protein